jgi:hypothetical protein
MFHGVGFEMPPNVRVDQKLLRERMASVDADQKRIGDILVERTNLLDADVDELFREATTKDANVALAKGLIGGIREVNIPKGAVVDTLVLGG